jgi:iron complex outermembrane recepter protein
MNRISFVILIVIFSWAPSLLLAQNQLSGTIRDNQSGLVLSGVSVYIPDIKTGAVSDAQGHYLITGLPSGNFLIEVSNVGYARQIEHITIHGTTEKDFSMALSRADLQEVLVTGVSSATERRKNPVPSSVLTQKDLQQTVSANIIDALQTVPGMSQITEGPALSKPVLRGLGYNRVVVVNDGVRQEGQQWGDEFGIEIDEYTVNRVEILKGPSSLSYGSDAMAGVINFLGPAPLPEGQIKGSILANYQTNNGLYAGSFNLAGNQKGFIWDLRYTLKQAHDYQNKYDGYVWNSGYGENNFKAIIGLNKKWGYSHLRLSLYDLKLGIIEGARDEFTGQFTKHYLDAAGEDSLGIAPAEEYKKYDFHPIIHQHVRHFKAVWDNQIFLGQGRLSVKLGLQQNFRQEANDITLGDVYNNYFYLRTINYDVQYLLPEKDHFSLAFGVNGMGQKSEDRGTVFLVPEYNLFDFGVYSTARKNMGKLTLSGGLRFDTRSLHTQNLYINADGERLPGPDGNSITRFSAFQSNFSGLSGSLGIAYDFTKSLYGKLNFSRGFRAPTIAESGSDGIHDGTPFYEIGDPTLKAENSLQVDATLGLNTEDISSELNLFINNINNYIFPVKLASVNGGDSLREDITSGLPAGPAFKFVSGDAVLSGGEFTFNLHPHAMGWLNWENSFSMIHAIQKNQGDSTKYLPYTPPNKLMSAIRIGFNNSKSVFRNTFFRIGVENYAKQDKIYYKFGDETVTPGYTLLNVGIGTEIYANQRSVCSLYILANNLTDVAYQSNMSRIKYGDVNNVTGRVGVYNMGRNISLKVIVPINIRN